MIEVLDWKVPKDNKLAPSKIIKGKYSTYTVDNVSIELHFSLENQKAFGCKKWTVGTFGESGRIFVLSPADPQLPINANGFKRIGKLIKPVFIARNGVRQDWRKSRPVEVRSVDRQLVS